MVTLGTSEKSMTGVRSACVGLVLPEELDDRSNDRLNLPPVAILCNSCTKEFSFHLKLWGKSIARSKTVTVNFDRHLVNSTIELVGWVLQAWSGLLGQLSAAVVPSS